MTTSGLACFMTTGAALETALDKGPLRVVSMIGRTVVGMVDSVPFGGVSVEPFTFIVICTPVDVVGVLVFLSRSVVFVVFVDTTGMVIGTAASDFNTVMFGFTVLTPLLTVSGFLDVMGLVTIGNVVGVTFVDLLVIVTGSLVDRVESLEVVLAGGFGCVVCLVDTGALVVRVRLFLSVEFVRVFFRLVKVVTLLRVGVTLGVLCLTTGDVGEVKGAVL